MWALECTKLDFGSLVILSWVDLAVVRRVLLPFLFIILERKSEIKYVSIEKTDIL